MLSTMERRRHGEGGVRQRADGRWEATITVCSIGGKRQRKYFYGKTREEAHAALRAASTGSTEPENLVSTLLGQRRQPRSTIRDVTGLPSDACADIYRGGVAYMTQEVVDDLCRHFQVAPRLLFHGGVVPDLSMATHRTRPLFTPSDLGPYATEWRPDPAALRGLVEAARDLVDAADAGDAHQVIAAATRLVELPT